MDHGVIRVPKAFYRTNVVRREIKHIDAGRTTPNINILEAMLILARSWDPVSANIVNNCFTKASIPKKTKVGSKSDVENVNELKLHGLVYGDLTADDYINIDYIDFVVCTSKTSHR